MNNAQSPFTKTLIAAAVIAVSAATVAGAMAQGLVLEEVIVTAQKRQASVQDISATVNVVSGDALEKFNTFNFREVEEQTAGLSLDRPNARNSRISMRGIGTDPEAGLPPAVDTYWNGINIRPDVAFTQIYDLQRLEILRGPQGTLQGRTSPAGAINIITRSAGMDEATGMITLSASDNEGFNGQLGYGAPLIDGVLGLRVAAAYETSYANDVENITSGLDDPESAATSARISLAWAPTDNFDAGFVYQYLDQDIDDNKAISGIDSVGVRPSLNDADRISLGKSDNFGAFEFDLASLTLTWMLGDLEITAVTGYNDSTKDSRTENDRAHYATTPAALTFQTAHTEVESIVQEIRIASVDNDFWDYMVGIYYLDQETTTVFIANTTSFQLLGSSFATTGAIPVDNEESGIFTFNTLYLTDVLQLEVGLRWSNFDRFRRADVFYDGTNYAAPPLTEEIIDTLVGGSGSFPIIAVSKENESAENDTVTGSLTLRYEWTDDVSGYANYNRGYRPSGISIIPDPDVQFLPNGENDLLHGEENSDSIELGFKSRLLDGRASLNGALFYQQFDGYLGFVRGVQVLNAAGAPVDISGGLIFNGDANILGVELEGQLLLSESWSAGGSMSYVNAEWDGAESPCNEREPGEVLGFCDIDGENIGGEPQWSFSLNSEYFVTMENMQWYLRGLLKYKGERDNVDASAGIGAVVDEFDEYTTFNLYTGLRSTDYSWDVSLWAKNLFDEDAVTFQTGSDQYDLALSGGSYTQINVLNERTIGVTARYNF